MTSRVHKLCGWLAIAVCSALARPLVPAPDGWRTAAGEGEGKSEGKSKSESESEGEGEGEGEAGKKDPEKKTPEKKKATKKKPAVTKDSAPKDPDAAYVKEHLEDFLSATKVEFLKDGRVSLSFDFRAKNEEHNEIFSVPVGDNNKQAFRWTFWEEESVIGGDRGIRLSDTGISFLKAWFVDEVEAEIEYLQHINFANRHFAAVIFGTPKRAVASNFGTQTCFFANGAKGKVAGKPQPVVFNTTAKIKLVVKDGKFEAHRNGARKSEQSYDRKTYASGQIGIIWGGSMAATVPSLTIKGKLDTKKMAEEIRKGLARKGEE